jgi:hypothetical protein
MGAVDRGMGPDTSSDKTAARKNALAGERAIFDQLLSMRHSATIHFANRHFRLPAGRLFLSDPFLDRSQHDLVRRIL